MFVKINSERHHLWRSVDHEGAVLESFATRTRGKKAAPLPGSGLLANHEKGPFQRRERAMLRLRRRVSTKGTPSILL